MHPIISAGLALALATPLAATAQAGSDLESLRREIESIRSAYEQRLQALEQRLKAAEAQIAPAAPGAPAATAATAPAPAGARSGGGANTFNPAMSVILSGTYARTSRDPANYALTGFALPVDAEVGPGPRGFSLAETEVTLSANIDPWLRGVATIAFSPENEVSVEEAFVQTTSLGRGLTLKAGRFFSGVGYLNEQHRHAWDFVDSPLAYQAFLGGQFGDDGLQLRWLAPTDLYLELGAEVGRGRGVPGSNSNRNGAGARSVYAHAGGDVGESNSWRAGLSVLNARPGNLTLSGVDSLGDGTIAAFTGSNRVWLADFVWKWAPGGNATRTNFKLQGEYLRSRRNGELAGEASAALPVRASQSGWYLQSVYQFMPRWRVGLRTERLDSGPAGLLTDVAYRPRKNSLMLDFNPSEFSRVRLQLARDQSRRGQTDNQLFLQYQMSLGAHGAHGY